jgi:hypothetical protein
MAKPRDDRQKDLLRPALEAIIDLGHPLVRLACAIDWRPRSVEAAKRPSRRAHCGNPATMGQK